MKVKRLILYADHDYAEASCMKLLLETRGYRVLRCAGAGDLQTMIDSRPVDLLLIGPNFVFDEIVTVPTVHVVEHAERTQLLERIRIALIRKRGQKPATSSACKSNERVSA